MPAPTSASPRPAFATPASELGNAAKRIASAIRFGYVAPPDQERLRRALDGFSWTATDVVAVARQLRVPQAPAAVWLAETIALLRQRAEMDDGLLERVDTLAWALGQIA